jgi:signal transduction histidine kinase
MFNSIRLRLTLWYVMVLLGIVIATGVITFVMLSRLLTDEVDDSLRASANSVVGQVESGGLQALGTPTTAPVDDRQDGGGNGGNGVLDGHDGEEEEDHEEEEEHEVRFFTPQSGDTFYLVLSPDGNVLANPLNVSIAGLPDPEEAAAAASSGESWTDLTAGGNEYRIHSRAIREEGEATAVVQVGRSLEEHERQLQSVLLVLGLAGLGGLVLAAVGGLLLAGRALAPARLALQRQQEFVADASHELRTPLTVVRGNAEMLEMTSSGLGDEGRGYVEGIVGQVQYMERLTEDLSSLARLEQGEAPLRRQDFALEALLQDLAADTRMLGRHKGILVETESSPVTVNADRDRLREAILVLVDNAVRTSPPGGTVVISGLQANGGLVIEVADSGPGIPAEHLQRLFDRFYRVDTGRSRSEGGSGLGLAIAKAIVEAHGGTITAQNRPEGGALFRLSLPM